MKLTAVTSGALVFTLLNSTEALSDTFDAYVDYETDGIYVCTQPQPGIYVQLQSSPDLQTWTDEGSPIYTLGQEIRSWILPPADTSGGGGGGSGSGTPPPNSSLVPVTYFIRAFEQTGSDSKNVFGSSTDIGGTGILTEGIEDFTQAPPLFVWDTTNHTFLVAISKADWDPYYATVATGTADAALTEFLADYNAIKTQVIDPYVASGQAPGATSGGNSQTAGQIKFFRYQTPDLYLDSDGDGLTDTQELTGAYGSGNSYTSDPFMTDTDGDGISDQLELTHGGDPQDAFSFPPPLIVQIERGYDYHFYEWIEGGDYPDGGYVGYDDWVPGQAGIYKVLGASGAMAHTALLAQLDNHYPFPPVAPDPTDYPTMAKCAFGCFTPLRAIGWQDLDRFSFSGGDDQSLDRDIRFDQIRVWMQTAKTAPDTTVHLYKHTVRDIDGVPFSRDSEAVTFTIPQGTEFSTTHVDLTPVADSPTPPPSSLPVGNNGYVERVEVILAPFGPRVDYNRNGEDDLYADPGDIADPTKPFRFWINDDRDYGHDMDGDDRDPMDSAIDDDYEDNFITSLRDLEDFARLQVDLTPWKTQINAGTPITFGLKFTDVADPSNSPAIQIYQSEDLHPGSDEYVFVEENGLRQMNVFGVALGTVDQMGMTFTPSQITTLLQSSAYRLNLIFEGTNAGEGTLALTVDEGNGAVSEFPTVPMQLTPVKDMYEHWTMGDNITTSIASIQATAHAPTPDSGTIDPAWDLDDDCIVFVHGWRMRPWERRVFANTAFKRLWHQGFNGRFYFFSWPTEWVARRLTWPYEPLDYDNLVDSAEKAYWCGEVGLRPFLADLNLQFPGKVRLMAHSLGGVVSSEALRGNANLVHTYAAMQTAIATHAFDPSIPDRAPHPLANFGGWDTPEIYKDYPPTGNHYYESTTGVLYNMHNEQDDALDAFPLNEDFKPFNTIALFLNVGSYKCENFDEVANTGDFFREDPTPTGGTTDVPLFLPGDRFEIYAQCAEARCLALGAQGITTSRGNFNTNAGFRNAAHNFGPNSSEHSAQFRANNMIRHEFYERLLHPDCFDIATLRTKPRSYR